MADKDPNEPIKEEEVVETPPEVTPPESEEEPEVPEPEEVEEPEEEEEPAPPSRREQLRLAQVLEKLKQQPAAPEVPASPESDYIRSLDADPEVIKQLESDRNAAVKAALQQNNSQMQTIRWETLVNLDAPQVEAEHPELNKNSEDYHPALADSLSKMYFQLSGMKVNSDNTYTVTNPGVRWKEFIDSYFETADEIANEKVRASTKNIAKQAAQTAIRPTGGSGKRLNLNQFPNQMSDEELKAKIDQDLKALGLA